jgi:hypothetical protein
MQGKNLAALLPLLFIAACAYQRPMEVSQQMARTEAVLSQAESSGARENALSELQQAKDKYAEAQRAYEKESESGDEKALRLARQAELDAKYASAKAQALRQQEAAHEIQDGVRTLREEAQRNAANPPPVTSTY